MFSQEAEEAGLQFWHGVKIRPDAMENVDPEEAQIRLDFRAEVDQPPTA